MRHSSLPLLEVYRVIKCFACAFGPLDSPAAGWNFRHLKKLMDVAGSEANKDPLDSCAVAWVFTTLIGSCFFHMPEEF